MKSQGGNMRRALFTLVTVVVLGGCAKHHDGIDRSAGHHGPDGPAPAGLSHPSQKDSAQEALVLRREADQLREMAERREREALVLSSDPATDRQAIREKRELAQRLLEAADAADREARALSRQVPHNMVQ
jgi:hypothetical protein